MFRYLLLVIIPIFMGPSTLTRGNISDLKKWTEARGFKINGNVSKSDWQFFMTSSDKWRESLWKFYKRQGNSLEDWAWEWRLAWVRTCEMNRQSWCFRILKASLASKAVLVRSRGVKAWGRRYAGTGHINAGKELERVFTFPKNDRNNRPLFIKNRILFALIQIGGKENEALAQRLADSHPGTRRYWTKITKTHP